MAQVLGADDDDEDFSSVAKHAVLSDSAPVDERVTEIHGLNWDKGIPDVVTLMDSFIASGFQATQIGRAVEEVRRMIDWRPGELEVKNNEIDPCTRCTIWLSFTSNMISSGLREVFVYLAKHRMIDVIVTSAGGIEEDFVKCLAPTLLGDFQLEGRRLRRQGWNRIGNLIVPNKNYCEFETWVQPLLDECLTKQNEEGAKWTPSKLIDFLGSRTRNESSLYYWCHRNSIPVFCPGLTDGSLGDNLYFHSYRNPGLVIDVVDDIRRINDIAVKAKMSGMIILGGGMYVIKHETVVHEVFRSTLGIYHLGIAKHHTCNANLMRNGADFAVYVNTAQEFDGCDSGARPDEAISWGKIRMEASPVKVYCDATIAFPLIVTSSFMQATRD